MLAVLIELEGCSGEWKFLLVGRHAGEALSQADRLGKVLSVHLLEQGFVIEEVELRGCAVLEEVDDPFCLWCKMREAKLRLLIVFAAEEVGDQQGAEGDAADAKAGALKKAPSVYIQVLFEDLFFQWLFFMSW